LRVSARPLCSAAMISSIRRSSRDLLQALLPGLKKSLTFPPKAFLNNLQKFCVPASFSMLLICSL
jgi:hypothetical protein